MTPDEIARKLRPQTAAILTFLSGRDIDRDVALAAPEIGIMMRNRRIIRANNAGEWARPKLNKLRDLGLVEMLGSTYSGARTWDITDLGRTVAAIRAAGDPRP